jgi:hypothetical protein
MTSPNTDIAKRLTNLADLMESGLYEERDWVDIDRAVLREAASTITEYDQLFDLQWKRMGEATTAWRAAHPGKDDVQPDLGTLLTWLLDRIRTADAYCCAKDDPLCKHQRRKSK